MAYFVYTKLLFIFALFSVDSRRKMTICGNKHLMMQNGTIQSPYYPLPYPERIDCTWTILPPPNAPLIIMVRDIDIKEDQNCTKPPCCASNHLSLPSNDSGENINFCGDFTPNGPINLIKNLTIIKYKSSEISRGFYLSYIIGRTVCEKFDFRCGDGTCLPKSVRCDSIVQCNDESDELDCPGFNVDSNHRIAHINAVFQKMFDLKRIAMARTNSSCPGENCRKICGFNEKLCFSGKCVDEKLWCNTFNDCGDASDEDDCSKNGMITLFMMGSLLTALILVVGIMCALRYQDRRNFRRDEEALYSDRHIIARMSNVVSLPELDDEFLYRDPPPSYAVAMGQCEPELNNGELDPLDPRNRSRALKPPTPPPSSESSNQSSPSRNSSITSSSYLSTDGSIHLLSQYA